MLCALVSLHDMAPAALQSSKKVLVIHNTFIQHPDPAPASLHIWGKHPFFFLYKLSNLWHHVTVAEKDSEELLLKNKDADWSFLTLAMWLHPKSEISSYSVVFCATSPLFRAMFSRYTAVTTGAVLLSWWQAQAPALLVTDTDQLRHACTGERQRWGAADTGLSLHTDLDFVMLPQPSPQSPRGFQKGPFFCPLLKSHSRRTSFPKDEGWKTVGNYMRCC